VKDTPKSIPPFFYRTGDFDVYMAIEKGPVVDMNKGAIRARYNSFRDFMVG
jgi:hypothetical protein